METDRLIPINDNFAPGKLYKISRYSKDLFDDIPLHNKPHIYPGSELMTYIQANTPVIYLGHMKDMQYHATFVKILYKDMIGYAPASLCKLMPVEDEELD